MTDDDFVSLNVMVVSETAADRELIRRCAASASIPVRVSEIVAAGDAVAALKKPASGAWDVVLFDRGLPASGSQALRDAVRGQASRPLTIAIGEAAALDVDGAMAKPLEEQQVSELISACITARLAQ